LKSVELVALTAKIIFQHDDQARRQPRFFVGEGIFGGQQIWVEVAVPNHRGYVPDDKHPQGIF